MAFNMQWYKNTVKRLAKLSAMEPANSWSAQGQKYGWIVTIFYNNNNNNNNNPICKAPECQKTSVALAERNSRVN